MGVGMAVLGACGQECGREKERAIQGFVHGRAVERALLDMIFALFVL